MQFSKRSLWFVGILSENRHLNIDDIFTEERLCGPTWIKISRRLPPALLVRSSIGELYCRGIDNGGLIYMSTVDYIHIFNNIKGFFVSAKLLYLHLVGCPRLDFFYLLPIINSIMSVIRLPTVKAKQPLIIVLQRATAQEDSSSRIWSNKFRLVIVYRVAGVIWNLFSDFLWFLSRAANRSVGSFRLMTRLGRRLLAK